MSALQMNALPKNTAASWTLLTNHSHVLVCLAREGNLTVRELALRIGITERSVQRILSDLTSAEAIGVTREGRRNRYTVNESFRFRHELESQQRIGGLLDLFR